MTNFPKIEENRLQKLLTIVVTSCDDFEECWGPFAHGLDKYWADCIFPAILITNNKTFVHPKLRATTQGADKGWASNLIEALHKLSTPYILYLQEDYWLKTPVSTQTISRYLSLLESNNIAYLRLYPCPPPTVPSSYGDNIGTIPPGEPYRTSLQAAIWKKSVMLNLLQENESPWHFEIDGSKRSTKAPGEFLSVKRFLNSNPPATPGIDYVCTAINKGRWSKEAVEYARNEGLNIDFSNRPHETWWHDFLRSTSLGMCCARFITKGRRTLNISNTTKA